MKCPKCGKQAVAIVHDGTEVIAFYVCWDCEKIIEKVLGKTEGGIDK